jgi:hypothetical protein
MLLLYDIQLYNIPLFIPAACFCSLLPVFCACVIRLCSGILAASKQSFSIVRQFNILFLGRKFSHMDTNYLYRNRLLLRFMDFQRLSESAAAACTIRPEVSPAKIRINHINLL